MSRDHSTAGRVDSEAAATRDDTVAVGATELDAGSAFAGGGVTAIGRGNCGATNAAPSGVSELAKVLGVGLASCERPGRAESAACEGSWPALSSTAVQPPSKAISALATHAGNALGQVLRRAFDW